MMLSLAAPVLASDGLRLGLPGLGGRGVLGGILILLIGVLAAETIRRLAVHGVRPNNPPGRRAGAAATVLTAAVLISDMVALAATGLMVSTEPEALGAAFALLLLGSQGTFMTVGSARDPRARGLSVSTLGLAVGLFGAHALMLGSLGLPVADLVLLAAGGGVAALAGLGGLRALADGRRILPLLGLTVAIVVPALTTLGLGGHGEAGVPWQRSAVAAAVALLGTLLLAMAALHRSLSNQADSEAARLSRFAEASFEGIAFLHDGVLTDGNAAVCGMLGPAREALLGTPAPYLFARDCRAELATAVGTCPREARLLCADGRERPVELRRERLSGALPASEMLVVRDLADRRAAEARIERLAHYDPLTGLANRALFRDRLAQALATVARSGQGLALLCIDLDGFRAINDQFGPAIGDRLLTEAGARLATVTRDMDTTARLGADEFAIVQPFARQTDAAALAARLVARLAEPYRIDGLTIPASASIGIAIHPGDGQAPETLLRNAVQALARARVEGGTFRFFEPAIDARLRERRQTEQDLRAALGTAALQVHYQPLFDVESLGLVGYEALLRWQHPVRGPISPAEFIPLAEESGAILPLGRFVLQTACRTAAGWTGGQSVAVNLSAVQFKQSDLPQMVAAILAETGLPPERLELEVTESVLIDDAERALVALAALKALGVRIALDDFGTGYSSLSYLRRFPFDKIKIDRSFVQGLGEDAEAEAIVRSIVALGRSLNLSVTAEGVETELQLSRLRAQRCTEVQGFLLGRPMPQEALPAPARIMLDIAAA